MKREDGVQRSSYLPFWGNRPEMLEKVQVL